MISKCQPSVFDTVNLNKPDWNSPIIFINLSVAEVRTALDRRWRQVGLALSRGGNAPAVRLKKDRVGSCLTRQG